MSHVMFLSIAYLELCQVIPYLRCGRLDKSVKATDSGNSHVPAVIVCSLYVNSQINDSWSCGADKTLTVLDSLLRC